MAKEIIFSTNLLSNGFSWKQMYENIELKRKKRPVKNGILGSFYLFLFLT